MNPKRGDRAAPPPGRGDWEIRFRDNESANGWEDLCKQAPGNTLAAWTIMRTSPAPPVESRRHHRLRAELAAPAHRGRHLERWQIEVTGAGRIWYLVDRERTTIWIDEARSGHPKATE